MNIVDCTYTNLGGVYTPRIFGIAYCSWTTKHIQQVAVPDSVGNGSTKVLVHLNISKYRKGRVKIP